MIPRRDAKVVMDRLHGRTFQSIGNELNITASRAQAIYQRTVQMLGYRHVEDHPKLPYYHVFRVDRIPPEDLVVVGALLRDRTHPRRPDPDTPEGFVVRGEVRTGRRWED